MPCENGRKATVVYEIALRILQTLEKNGYEAYFVGGCVRDWLLHRTVHDIDICTNAHPGDVMTIFPDHVLTGLKHGTVSVKLEGLFFEVTTYRTEGKYEDYRRPSTVQFVSELRLDLQRRDFTINAMAMDRNRRLHDPFDGQEDLKKKQIRAVGEAVERFQEDALRLLRAVRFAAQLSFDIESKTMAAMKQTAPLLAHIAVERVREEVNKMLASAAPQWGCQLLCEAGLFVSTPLLERLFQHGSQQAWRLSHVQDLVQKWALLFYAAEFTLSEVKQVATHLKMSKRESESLLTLLGWLEKIRPDWDIPKDIEWRTLILDAGLATSQEVNSLLLAIWWQQRQQVDTRALHRAYDSLPVKNAKELAVTGFDLQAALKKHKGEWIGRVLVSLLHQTAFEGLPNTPEALIAAAKNEVARNEY